MFLVGRAPVGRGAVDAARSRGTRRHGAAAERARRSSTAPTASARARLVPPPPASPRTSGARRRRARPVRRSSIRTGPIRTRTSRSIGAPTAPNIRRSWRFQPWARIARYQTRASGRRVEERHQPRGLELGRRSEARERRQPFVERDAALQAVDLLGREGPAQADGVFAFDAVARMEDPLGPVAVVRQDEEALGILVEAADRVEPGAFGNERRREQLEDGPRRRAGHGPSTSRRPAC